MERVEGQEGEDGEEGKRGRGGEELRKGEDGIGSWKEREGEPTACDSALNVPPFSFHSFPSAYHFAHILN